MVIPSFILGGAKCAVPTAGRMDCASDDPSITKESCRGLPECCWDDSTDGVIWCYYNRKFDI